ncbi:DUF4124 domain-containing protein [Stutzerimonas azotifigens]|uniref:DUF4124 domain-containing protein n=1 Tax=Stutzerimonas azotifigens TaxID=291995 RepID=UPI0004274043|nr:DUF4124 domain-containing protein [Stutzerimonas azotifigens]
MRRLAYLLCVLSLPALAQIYQYNDENGNPVFTNQPPEGIDVKEVELPPANSVNLAPVDIETAPPMVDASQAGQPYQVLAIGGIPDEEALRANGGSFTVQAVIEPRLQPTHRVRFILDGTPIMTSTATSVQLNDVARGEHRLQVQILSGQQVVQSSPVETFTVQRVHTSSPALRPAPRP